MTTNNMYQQMGEILGTMRAIQNDIADMKAALNAANNREREALNRIEALERKNAVDAAKVGMIATGASAVTAIIAANYKSIVEFIR